MTVKGGTTPACAACKYQRRKCSPSCPLAPYFPANQPKMFQNVHRLFGVSNVTKTLQNIKCDDLKDDAMRSIIYEAEIRARFPVHGCCGVMAHLRHQLHMACEELHFVCANLDAYRNRAASGNLDCWLDSSNDGAYGVGHGQPPLLTLEPFSDAAMMMSGNLGSVQAQMDLVGVQESCNSIDFDGQQFCYGGGERQSNYSETKIESRDAFESSPESTLEDAAEHGCRREMKGGSVAVVENGCRRELRTAAAGFSLTTVN